MMKKVWVLLMALILLSACGLTREKLGMTRSKPDETQVLKRQPLVVPPDFDVRPQ